MKKIIFVTALFLALNFTMPETNAQSEIPSAGFVINLTADHTGQKMVYLSARNNTGYVNLDSSGTTSFPVILEGKLDAPEMLFFRLEGSNTLVPVFIENSHITVYTDFADPTLTRVEGSAVHKEFIAYNTGLVDITVEKPALIADWRKARDEGNITKRDSIEKIIDRIEENEYNYNLNYVQKNNKSYISPYIIRRTLYYTLELDELKNMLISLDPSLGNSVYVRDLIGKIAVLEKVAVGQKYTDIILPGLDGSEMKLSGFTGKSIILVDFWASWCGPCRVENPEVVKLYKEYHSKGFDIVGVSFDTDEKNWKKAIESDGLVWNHMSDLKGWNSKAAELYGVSSIPHTVLIDRNGIIVAKNLRGEELREKLSDLLN